MASFSKRGRKNDVFFTLCMCIINNFRQYYVPHDY